MGKKSGFFAEFQKYICRGNVMEMEVGDIIGGAFSSIINSLVTDIISPVLGIFGGMNFDSYCITLAGDATLNYGKFLTAVVNFLIMALVIFCMMRTVNSLTARLIKKKEEEPKAAPTTKICPYCKSEIPIDAIRCAHCTSELPETGE